MKSEDFVRRIKRLHPLQSVTLHFAENGVVGLNRLYMLMLKNEGVRLGFDEERSAMHHAIEADNPLKNRTFTVYGLQLHASFGPLDDICEDVERVETSDHPAKALMSGRDKKRLEAAAEIAGGIFTQNFVAEMRSWDFETRHILVDDHGLPVLILQLSLIHGDVQIALAIDGWSGGMAVGGRNLQMQYIVPGEVQRILRKELEQRLEVLTAA